MFREINMLFLITLTITSIADDISMIVYGTVAIIPMVSYITTIVFLVGSVMVGTTMRTIPILLPNQLDHP